jgi:hypothetical protein
MDAVLSSLGVTLVGSAEAMAEAEGPASDVMLGAQELAGAMAVQARHEETLLRTSGVVGMGLGRSESHRVVIEIYLERLTAQLQHAMPSDLEGIPVKLVVTGPYEAR